MTEPITPEFILEAAKTNGNVNVFGVLLTAEVLKSAYAAGVLRPADTAAFNKQFESLCETIRKQLAAPLLIPPNLDKPTPYTAPQPAEQ